MSGNNYLCKDQAGNALVSIEKMSEDIHSRIKDKEEITELAVYSRIKDKEPIALIDEKLLEYYT